MSTYYRGNLEADIAGLAADSESAVNTLGAIGRSVGYGRAQQILQILWAKSLSEQGIPPMGALLPEPLESPAAAPVSPAAQATDSRMAAVEQAAALAEKVSGPDTARTIRHNGVVMRGDCECTMCKRYNHVEG